VYANIPISFNTSNIPLSQIFKNYRQLTLNDYQVEGKIGNFAAYFQGKKPFDVGFEIWDVGGVAADIPNLKSDIEILRGVSFKQFFTFYKI
jgi:hypothetical protein